jgi:outer membrane lipoprotein-sorting protein
MALARVRNVVKKRCGCMCKICLSVWLLSLALQAGTGEIESTVAGWLAQQTNIQSWAADFTQTRTLKALAQPLISTGQVWFAAPQNFRWELGSNQTIAIRNQDVMLVVYPRLKRAERYRFDAASRSEWRDTLALLQSGFPRSREDLDRQFSIRSATPMNDLVQVELEPKSVGARKMMPRIHVFLSTNLTLAGTELVFMDGSRMRNDFRHVRTNADVAGRFDLRVPPDFKMVEPLREGRK